MREELAKDVQGIGYNGIIFDTGANRSGFMSLAEYLGYCEERKVPAV